VIVRQPAALGLPPTDPHMDPMTLYRQIDDAAIAALVARFYEKVRADGVIGPLFNEAVADWPEHLDTLNKFWSSVMLGTGRYKGNPMAVHARQPIRPEFFPHWLDLWRETAGELFTPEAAAQFGEKADRIAESLKLGLFYRPGALDPPRRPA
jgi:hemoglobin